MRYLRNKFAFYGLQAPEWVAILKREFKQNGKYQGAMLHDFVRLCFEDDYREIHYTGLQMLEKQIRTLPAEDIQFLEACICSQSWWDTVDWVSKLVGLHFRRYRTLQRPTCERWVDADNIWLQRVTMIHQLSYKEHELDADLLLEMITRLKSSREFFVQKGAGWALRQYSKIAPEAVTTFIERNPDLAPLTRREGLKWLKKHGIGG